MSAAPDLDDALEACLARVASLVGVRPEHLAADVQEAIAEYGLECHRIGRKAGDGPASPERNEWETRVTARAPAPQK